MNPSELIRSAAYFAQGVHAGQLYGDKPYAEHLYEVVHRLTSYNQCPAELLAAAYLHDTLEDHGSRVSLPMLQETFGLRVADLVYAVTDRGGASRKARHKATYPGIVAYGPEAVAIKLADRIANVVNCQLTGYHKLRMYEEEWPDFQRMLRVPLKDGWALKAESVYPMWNDLTVLMEAA